MSALVVNRIKLSVPAEQVVPDIERVFPSAFRAQPGFERFELVRTGPSELVVVIRWSSVEAAAAGAAFFGPGLFHTYIAPHAESQDRVVGEVVVDVG